MMFPRHVFRDGGNLDRAGGSYSSMLVEDEAAYDAALADGWYATLPEAIAADDEESLSPRAELEEMARELGVQFDGRTSDKKLLEKVKAAAGEE